MKDKQHSKAKSIFSYIVLGLILAIIIAASICTLVLEEPKLQVIWMGGGLLILNLLILLVFVGRNIR
ncbi:Uncharacterised protein [Porphyromonas crevioricanis]|uniref:Uncharacterized protein n=1 Tax=Porphyromonas crevioricanis TaxID=393921 RepID=A0A2X4SR65_9PORP|nr:hypothetical protein [Porphyromonas crevioricanis]GAD07924.1 hypothetical protein PORCAN_1553 [Porphyromonas crevioricanis JCM 13913]SQH72381.1 Uncharacterised protein [Porphyromonas crevioricanis]